jgi:hypothetical protein
MATIGNDTITSLIICYFYMGLINFDFLSPSEPLMEGSKSISLFRAGVKN